MVPSQLSRYGEMDNNIQSISLVIHRVVIIAVKYVGGGKAMYLSILSIPWKLCLEGAEGSICFSSAGPAPTESTSRQDLVSLLMFKLIVL